MQTFKFLKQLLHVDPTKLFILSLVDYTRGHKFKQIQTTSFFTPVLLIIGTIYPITSLILNQ